MKKSDISVTMSMTTYEELLWFKENYIRLRNNTRDLLKKNDVDEGVDYTFNVKEAVGFFKKEFRISENANIDIIT